MIAVELLFFFWLALVLLSGLGILVERLLPREWRSYTVVLAPLVGYALLSLTGYYAVRTVFSLRWVFMLSWLLMIVIVVWVMWGRAREKRALRKTAPAGSQELLRPVRSDWYELGLHEHWPAVALCLAAILLAVLPLLSYGYSVPIGENWDPENYVPIAAYLEQGPVGHIVEMPPNPLRDMNASPPRIGMTLGFCILQGALASLPGFESWGALGTFAPTIALLYGLAVLAWYALFRMGFGLGRWAGLVAAAFAGLSALALWIAFFNFGMQMAALPLVPLALMLWLLVLRHPSWRTVALAGLAVAALPVAYYPALTVFVPAALGLGLYEVGRRWFVGGASSPEAGSPPGASPLEAAPTPPAAPLGAAPLEAAPTPSGASPLEAAPTGVPVTTAARWKRISPMLVAGLATAALSVVLAVGLILDYGQGFSFRYGQQTTTLGLFDFPTLAQLLGLAPFSRTPESLPALWSGLAAVLPWLVVVAAAAVLASRRPRWIWAAALVPVLLYLAWLRGWFLPLAEALHLSDDLVERFRPYPYAFLKGAVFAVPFFWGAAVDTGARLAAFRGNRPARRATRAALAGLLVLFLGLVLAADGRLVARYWGRPAHFDAAAMQVQDLAHIVPDGEEVYLTGRPERSRVLLGLFSYFLLDHPIQGRLSTGYGGYDRRLPGAEPDYALLDADDNPVPLGFLPADGLWGSGGMILYRRNPEVISFLDLRTDAYTGREPGEIHTKEPLTERLLQSFGVYPAIVPALSAGGWSGLPTLTLYADAERLSDRDDLAGAAGTRALLLAFAAFEPATVTLRWADGTSELCTLPAGVSTCRTGAHAVPTAVEIAAEGRTAVLPCWAALVTEDYPSGVQALPEEFVLLPYTSAGSSTLQVVLYWYSDNSRPMRLALEVWEDTYTGAQHYAWWGPAQLSDQGTLYLQADLVRRQAQLDLEGPLLPLPVDLPSHPGADDWPEVVDGSYFAALWVYYGGQVVEVLPVGRFTVTGGQVQGLEPIQPGARLVWPHSPPERSGVRFGAAMELAAYELADRTFSPGDDVPLALEWHALESVPVGYAVSVQLLKDGRLVGQWDGPLGQWYPTTHWRPGQFIRDDIPLRVPADAPSGRYQLIVAVYDPAAVTRLPVRAADGQEIGDYLDLGEVIIR